MICKCVNYKCMVVLSNSIVTVISIENFTYEIMCMILHRKKKNNYGKYKKYG